MKLSDAIIRPVITEKSVADSKLGKYTFYIRLDANKEEVTKEVKALFNVDAVSVNTLILPGKPKRVLGTRRYIKSSKTKKAIVQVKEGQKIDLFPKD